MSFVHNGNTYNSKKFPVLEYIFNQKTQNGTVGIGNDITFTLKDVSNGYVTVKNATPNNIHILEK